MASCTRKLFTALASEYANLRPAPDHPSFPMWEQMVARTMWRRVLRVATGVDLRHFESPEFYDHLDRVQDYVVRDGVCEESGESRLVARDAPTGDHGRMVAELLRVLVRLRAAARERNR